MLARRPAAVGLLALLILALVGPGTTRADAPRVLAPGAALQDSRLGPLKDLNGYFPFQPSPDKASWEKRAEQVRRRILVANGLWPMPQAAPLNAVVHGKVDRDGYTVEKVYLESYPGHFVTGSLFRPKGKSGKLPAVLCPHGHWQNGRFFDAGRDSALTQIVEGAERFEAGVRHPLQARCVQLARMGCIVFHYDMLGNADSQQLPVSLAHGYAKQRPSMDTPENWGFFSTQAELRQQSVMGLQTYNSIRALDWIASLPEVDATRIGVTGASGGGTQTFILCAIDPRPAVAFPAVMVSTAMQGGCTCENCSNLRVGTGNIEFAALMAPRPLGMTGADDWTKELATKGLPELKAHYAMLGVPDLVMGKVLPQFGHNYNFVSREVMYHFMNKHLKLGQPEPVIEEDFKPLSVAELTVWDAPHPKPPAGEDYERSLVKTMTADAERQIAALTPRDSASLARYREIVGGGVDVVVGRSLPAAGDVEFQQVAREPRGDYEQITGLVRYKPAQEEIPAVILQPKNWNKQLVIWVHEEGKAGLFGSDGSPLPEVGELLKAGQAVVGADLLYQGESLKDGKPLTQSRSVNNPREFAGYTLGYNASPFAQRTHDVLSLVAFSQAYDGGRPKVDLIGFGVAGAWAAAARAQASLAIRRSALDTQGFRFTQARSIRDLNLLPGGAKYGDLPGMLALGAPGELWLAGEGPEAPAVVAAAHKAAGGGETLTVFAETAPEKTKAAAIRWIVRP